jgi:hypothetical protein
MRGNGVLPPSTRNVVLSAVVLILALQVGANGQSSSSQAEAQRTYPIVSTETYNRVLDIVFPRDEPATSGIIFEFVLRFEPSFHATSQITIRKRFDKIEVIEYTSPEGNIFDKLNEILAHGGKDDPVAMAKSISVNRREISILDPQVKRWYATFFEGLGTTQKTLNELGEQSDRDRTVSLLLDGTTYDVWYKQGVNTVALSLYDVEIDRPGADGELKLVQWMNSIRREVAIARQQWQPASYGAITIGKSTRWDVIKAFGYPQREELENDPEDDQVWYVYHKGGVFPGEFTVAVDKKSELVAAMFFYTSNLSLKDVIGQFGKDYVLTRYAFCHGYEYAESAPVYESPRGSATYVEYRAKGVAMLVDPRGAVNDIRYLSGPIGFRSKQECPEVRLTQQTPRR